MNLDATCNLKGYFESCVSTCRSSVSQDEAYKYKAPFVSVIQSHCVSCRKP